MERLEINYPNGHMEIIVPVFFPCLAKTARKLYPLIKKYCPPKDRALLGEHLSILVKYCEAQVESEGTYRGDILLDWDPGGYLLTQRERETALKRAKANYKLYCQMEVDDEWMK